MPTLAREYYLPPIVMWAIVARCTEWSVVAVASSAADAAEVLEGQADVVDAVLAASRVFVAVASNALAGLSPEVTLPQFRALVLLEARGAMTVAELAAELRVAPSTASRMCDRLVTKKLVRRTVDRTDRRRARLTLHAAGHELIAASTKRRKHQIARLIKAIPAADRVQLSAGLRVLVAAAEASGHGSAPRST
jgi:DNA-binding MarR family transcriptional regulator